MADLSWKVSYDDLVALFGVNEDSKIMVELRTGIMNTFAERYLKSLVNEEQLKKYATDIKSQMNITMNAYRAAVDDAVRREFQEQGIGTVSPSSIRKQVALSDTMIKLIKDYIKAEFSTNLDAVIREQIDIVLAEYDIPTTINSIVEAKLGNAVNRAFEERLAFLNAKMKEGYNA